MKTINGHCLCKKVSLSLQTEKNTFDACHCSMCRRWGGSPGMTIHGLSHELKGQENISVYSSSDWAERAFCKQCGTHLYYHLKNSPFFAFPVGLFNDVDDFQFAVQIYTDSKPAFYDFANQTEMMTEAQVLAKFAPKEKE